MKNQMLYRLPRFTYTLIFLAGCLLACCTAPSQAVAQLPQDVRDVFEGMLDSLDDDLQNLFKEAIKKDTSSVEFTPKQFLRFRKNPANPFEGLDQIKVSENGNNLTLKFELPSIRKRKINLRERQHIDALRNLRAPARSAASCTVKIMAAKRHVAMGTVFNANGYIITKASEVENRKQLRCEFPDGSTKDAKLLRTDTNHDLAILEVDATNLNAIRWSDKQPLLGSFLLTPNCNGNLIAMGCYSVRPRSTSQGEQAYLGVQPRTTSSGVAVSEIRNDSAAYLAGLRNGDIIVNLGGQAVRDVPGLVKSIRAHRPGDKVKIIFHRQGSTNTTFATLAGDNIPSEQAARFKMMSRLGAIPSRRADNFPAVFQHDTPLFPEHCGGPIVNLDGDVVGLNIARSGRAATYAIPASVARTLIEKMMQENVAQVKPRLN